MRLLERDDRQVSLPASFSLMIPIEFVTKIFKRHEAEMVGVACVAGHCAKTVSDASHFRENRCRMRRKTKPTVRGQVCELTTDSGRIKRSTITAKGTGTKKLCTTKGSAF